MKKTVILFAMTMMISTPVFAWDGFNQTNGEEITIEKGELVREGKAMEVYDHESGNYKTVIVEDIRTTGIIKQIDITDPDTGETFTYDMIGR